MAEEIVLGIKVEGGASTIASLKKEQKELTAELSKTIAGSKEYLAVLQKLGNVKDEIGDLRDTISALNPEGKVAAFSNVAGKLAGGFQAATGAAALFGTKSEELEKTLLKVQAATAFAEGIRSLSGLSDAFAVVGTVIKTQVITALSSLKGALIATGIGAAAVALGILISKAIEYNEALEEEADKQKKVNEELKKTNDLYLAQAEASEKLRNARAGGINELERELKVLQAQGASADELAKKKQDILDKEIFNLKVRRSTLLNDAKQQAELDEKIKDKENEKLVAFEENEKRKREETKKTADEKKKIAEKAAEEEKTLFEKTYDEGKANQEKADEAERDRRQKEKDDKKTEDAALAEYLNLAQADEDQKAEANKERRKKDIDEMTAKEKAAAQEQSDAKVQAASQGFAAAKGLSEVYFAGQLARAKGNQAEELKIRKKMFEVDKAFSVARAVIDGIRSVQAALTIPPPAGYILAAANGVLAAVNIAKIASAKFDGGGSTGGGDISVPSTSVNIPSPPPPAPPNQPNTLLDGQGNNLTRQQPITVRAIVVETDITDSQNRVGKLQRQSSF
jgi:hypothetical protein